MAYMIVLISAQTFFYNQISSFNLLAPSVFARKMKRPLVNGVGWYGCKCCPVVDIPQQMIRENGSSVDMVVFPK